MTQTDIIPQVDGSTRYLYRCPRGTVAIDHWPHIGRTEVIRCLGGHALTTRDLRDAARRHTQLIAAQGED
jgi:hypothetical protein